MFILLPSPLCHSCTCRSTLCCCLKRRLLHASLMTGCESASLLILCIFSAFHTICIKSTDAARHAMHASTSTQSCDTYASIHVLIIDMHACTSRDRASVLPSLCSSAVSVRCSAPSPLAICAPSAAWQRAAGCLPRARRRDADAAELPLPAHSHSVDAAWPSLPSSQCMAWP